MTADTVDYGEWKSGMRVEAFSFGFLSLANKLSQAAAGWLLGFLLTLIGFVANTDLSEATRDGLKGITLLVPFVGLLISALVISNYPIDSRFHNEIVVELNAR